MHFNREHANKHEVHCNLQTFLDEFEEEVLFNCFDILGLN